MENLTIYWVGPIEMHITDWYQKAQFGKENTIDRDLLIHFYPIETWC